jgi:4-hydroxythreonine-4-phosphate dehydrogenase
MPICITLGDPAGIGPEVTFKAIKGIPNHPGIILFAHHNTLKHADNALRIKPYSGSVEPNGVAAIEVAHQLSPNNHPNDPTNAKIAFECLETALNHCKQHGSPLVTAPISKAGFFNAGIPFTDHTTWLKHAFNCPNAGMAFYSTPLNVVLATIHIALDQVPKALTKDCIHAALTNAITIAATLGINSPTIAIAGLNPHAGEHGQFGRFEVDALPAILESFAHGTANIVGPISPDTVFKGAVDGQYDIVVAMYHDQGLIPVKLLAFDHAVNVTVGLPICRTSPDHGTAYSIANKQMANPSAMASAIQFAINYGQ